LAVRGEGGRMDIKNNAPNKWGGKGGRYGSEKVLVKNGGELSNLQDGKRKPKGTSMRKQLLGQRKRIAVNRRGDRCG